MERLTTIIFIFTMALAMTARSQITPAFECLSDSVCPHTPSQDPIQIVQSSSSTDTTIHYWEFRVTTEGDEVHSFYNNYQPGDTATIYLAPEHGSAYASGKIRVYDDKGNVDSLYKPELFYIHRLPNDSLVGPYQGAWRDTFCLGVGDSCGSELIDFRYTQAVHNGPWELILGTVSFASHYSDGYDPCGDSTFCFCPHTFDRHGSKIHPYETGPAVGYRDTVTGCAARVYKGTVIDTTCTYEDTTSSDSTTAVRSVEGSEQEPSVVVRDGRFHVEGTDPELVEVFTLRGRRLRSSRKSSVPVPDRPGMYLVRIDGRSAEKVMVH